MLIIWYEDFDGTNETLEKATQLLKEIADTKGGSVQGPYFPQSEALMYLFNFEKFEQFNEAGKIFMTRVGEEELNITPLRYQVAITPDEFWGK
jgi:hypothetical protein